jgi:hypothetical protein
MKSKVIVLHVNPDKDCVIKINMIRNIDRNKNKIYFHLTDGTGIEFDAISNKSAIDTINYCIDILNGLNLEKK